jgi:hypothetical protein
MYESGIAVMAIPFDLQFSQIDQGLAAGEPLAALNAPQV